MNQLEAMKVFMQVAELGGFTAAAMSLGVPKASVSLSIQQLEELLGTRLFHRTTRKVQLTQDGQVFYERSKDLLADMDDLQGLFRQEPSALRGRLRVDMPLAVARDLVIPQLPTFLQAHPELELELSSTDRLVDIVREGFDCVLRAGELSDSSLIARYLGEYQMINCASPSYLARFGQPQNLAELAQHRLVHYVSVLGERSGGFEYQDPRDHSLQRLAMTGAITVNNSSAYVSACLAGLGLIQIPAVGVQDLLAERQLIEVLAEYRPAPMPVHLLYPNRRHLPQRVQVFMTWLSGLVQPRLKQWQVSH
ncbi:MAG: LysR family transcriptional regulator [Thiothrix sp.]|nr:MAG: LysR family transcriptional regulator [Thiothrix sp.]